MTERILTRMHCMTSPLSRETWMPRLAVTKCTVTSPWESTDVAPEIRMGTGLTEFATWTTLSLEELFSHIKTSTSWHEVHSVAEIRSELITWWWVTSEWRGEWALVVTSTLWQLSSSFSWEVQAAGWQHKGLLTPRSYATPGWTVPSFCSLRTDSRHCRTLERRL